MPHFKGFPGAIRRLDEAPDHTIADSIVDQGNAATTIEPTASAGTTIRADPQRVYDLVSDLPRMGEWSPENTGGRWIGKERRPVAGARFVGTNSGARRWWPTTTLVTEADAGRRFAFTTVLGAVHAAEWSYDKGAHRRGLPGHRELDRPLQDRGRWSSRSSSAAITAQRPSR